MSLTLHSHPLASFCWKALIALYDSGVVFTPHLVDLGDEKSRAAFYALSPLGKMPVLQDHARGEVVPETPIVIEYLAQHYPSAAYLLPADPDLARRVRLLDRVFDLYVNEPMQKIVTDNLRPEGKNDLYGVEAAREALKKTYAMLDGELRGREWAAGDGFTMADCAAAPALFYADMVEPFTTGWPNLGGYYRRLMARPSVARAVAEAQPYLHMVPYPPKKIAG